MIANFFFKLFPFAYIREIRLFLLKLAQAREGTSRILITFCALVEITPPGRKFSFSRDITMQV